MKDRRITNLWTFCCSKKWIGIYVLQLSLYSHLLKHKIKYGPDEKQQLCVGDVKDSISRLLVGIFFFFD